MGAFTVTGASFFNGDVAVNGVLSVIKLVNADTIAVGPGTPSTTFEVFGDGRISGNLETGSFSTQQITASDRITTPRIVSPDSVLRIGPNSILFNQFSNNIRGDDTAALYLASNDLSLNSEQMTAIYQKRWKVEEYHKSIKSNTCFAKSPTRTVITQKSHFIASIGAFNQFELLKMRKNQNHFALKRYINIMAMRKATNEVQQLLTPNIRKVA